MKKLLFLLALFASACTSATQEKFSLTGNSHDIPDGSIAYLYDYLLKEVIDSVVVESNSFRFDTEVAEYPRLVSLYSSHAPEDERNIWLENKPLTLDASQTPLYSSTVQGSATEDLYHAHRKDLDTTDSYDIRMEKRMAFVESHPNSTISTWILSYNKIVFGKDRTQALYDGLNEEQQQNAYGKVVSDYLAMAVEPEVGEEYVDFSMTDTTGQSLKLSEHLSKITLLEFWSSSCYPCRAENPNLVKTYKKYHAQGFEVFAVSTDRDKKKWQGAIEEDGLPWLHVSDLEPFNNQAKIMYGVKGIPDNFLIDESGTIIARNLRGEKLTQTIAKLLGGTD
ncbi:MAG TPA: hypothetical protein DCE41_04925 [Cytophagales bacterium]|nr:hypothetical protein [Cytophagales bacterium]